MSTLSKLHLSELAPHVTQSEIRAMTAACTAAHGINLAQGVCDTDPPLAVVDAAIEAAKSGHNTYSRHEGIDRLRQAIAGKFATFNGLSVDPMQEVLVTSGATGAMNAAIMALLDPGDACVVFEPFYGYHLATLRTQRVTPIIVPLEAPSWEIDVERLRAAVTPRTRAIIVNTPSNPSGKVFSLQNLQAVADVAIEHDLFVFTDEMYEYFLYDGARHISLATLDGMRERTITISGFSKTFSVTGWRLGYLSADPRWLPAIGHFHDLTYVCAPTPFQYGVAAGLLTLPAAFYADLATEYQVKRDTLCAALAIAGLTPSVPAGAYYVLADATNVQGAAAPARARQLLAETGLAAVAGSAFFAENRGDHLLRFCFAKKADVLDEACRRLRAWRAYTARACDHRSSACRPPSIIRTTSFSETTVPTELYFEDLHPGQTFPSQRSYKVTAEEIKSFAEAYDPQPFHLDEAAGESSFFKGLAASGWLTAAIVMRLRVESISIAGGMIGAGVDEMRWMQPVRPGDSLRTEAEILETRLSQNRPSFGIVKSRTLVYNQKDELVMRAVVNFLAPLRDTR